MFIAIFPILFRVVTGVCKYDCLALVTGIRLYPCGRVDLNNGLDKDVAGLLFQIYIFSADNILDIVKLNITLLRKSRTQVSTKVIATAIFETPQR